MAVQQAQVHESSHPTPMTYIVIAVILTVITTVEVAAVYMEGLRPLLVPILLVLSAGKFVVVVGFYMHLKFDARLFTTMFTVVPPTDMPGAAHLCAAPSLLS